MRFAAAALIVLALAGACGGQPTTPSPSGGARLSVVTTTTVLADFVREVGGARVEVHALVPKGGDVHTFDPAPSDAAQLSDADLLVMNGLGLDDWLLTFAEQAGAQDAPVIQLGVALEDARYIGNNPHLWLNPIYASAYVDRIRLKLIELDADGQQTYDTNASAYDDRLTELDNWARGELAGIPAADRRVVSFHDAFPYFAAAYDLQIVDVLVAAPGQDPSPAEVARVIEAIRTSGVKAILAEAQFSDELARTIAAETGAVVVNELYTDSLGDPPVDTYEGALRHDVEQIAAALR